MNKFLDGLFFVVVASTLILAVLAPAIMRELDISDKSYQEVKGWRAKYPQLVYIIDSKFESGAGISWEEYGEIAGEVYKLEKKEKFGFQNVTQ